MVFIFKQIQELLKIPADTFSRLTVSIFNIDHRGEITYFSFTWLMKSLACILDL